MIVAKSSDSTARAFGYDNYAYDYKRYENYKAIKEDKLKAQREKQRLRLRKQLKLISMVAIMFSMSIFIVGRYAVIMNMNNQSISLKSQISENQKINDDLKLQSMKYSDIKEIEEYATTEAKMVRPDITNIVHINVPETGNTKEAEKTDDENKKVSFFGRVISFFE